jgi:hypothetical protein
MGRRSWAALPTLPRTCVGRPRSHSRARSPLWSLWREGPHVSRFLLLPWPSRRPTPPQPNPTVYTGISYPKTSYWSYKSVAACSLVPFYI